MRTERGCRDAARRATASCLVTAAAGAVCFGLIGIVACLPPVRARLRQALGRRFRHRTISTARNAVLIAAALLLTGAGVRAASALEAPLLCHSTITADGDVVSEPLLDAATSGSPTWHAIRSAIVAPVSGLALAASSTSGMHICSGPPLLVAFDWPADATAGTMIGDVFVTWTPDPSGGPRVSTLGRGPIHRFGPNIPGDRTSEEHLERHESRHVDQWAVGTLIGGPAAFPLAYGADALLFPDARSHFERAASLADGGYPQPDDFAPRPRWIPMGALGALGALGLLLTLRAATGRSRSSRAPWPPGHAMGALVVRPRSAPSSSERLPLD